MKILFTADLHIKLNQKNIPPNWAINRYNLLFKELEVYSTQVDLTVIGGDIFDRIPSMEELELYFKLVQSIKSPCIIYSGNHEAIKKNTTFFTNLAEVTNNINYKVRIIDDFYSYRNIDFIPYNKLKEWEKDPDNTFVGLGNILCTHVRGDIPPHVKAEISLELFDKWDIVLAGDLHSYANSQRNILYPGSPISTSFHRNMVECGIIILDSETLKHEWIELALPQLIRKTIKVGEPMPATDYHHTIYEVEGDMSQLNDVENSSLLDKKVLKRESDTTLILNTGMTLQEEVEEYLMYVLNINTTSTKAVLDELNNHIGKLIE